MKQMTKETIMKLGLFPKKLAIEIVNRKENMPVATKDKNDCSFCGSGSESLGEQKICYDCANEINRLAGLPTQKTASDEWEALFNTLQ